MAEGLLKIPANMTQEGLERMTVYTGVWRRSSNYVCLTCGEAAFYHPYTNQIWGCKRCGFTTVSVSVFFGKTSRRKSEEDSLCSSEVAAEQTRSGGTFNAPKPE